MRGYSLFLLPLIALTAPVGCDDSVPARTDGGVIGGPLDAASETGPVEVGPGDAGARQPVTIEFLARVGAMPFSCTGSYPGLGADEAEVKPGDFRFYVQDVMLLDEQGRAVPVVLDADGRWQQSSVALLDFEDKQDECVNGTEPTNNRIIGSVPVGRYRGLKFVVGVPFELNHRPLTASKAPLDLTALFWSWNSGHLFLKAETSALVTTALSPPDAGVADAGAAEAGTEAGHGPASDGPGADLPAGPRRNVFVLHAGSTLCEGKATEGALVDCKHPNRGAVELPDFQPGSNRVVVDFAAIFAESQLQSLPGCHSFAGGEACVGPFDRIGVDWITGRPTPSTQRVFQVE